MKKVYTITIEIELETDEEGLTDDGWATANSFQNALEKLQYDYGWSEIKKIGMPKRKGD